MKKNNKGFTLVELIVVLVILAILAAILVPTLLGYIDRARAEKDYSTAQTVRVAAQAAIDQAYGDGVKTTDTNGNAGNVTKIEDMTGTIKGTYSVSGTTETYGGSGNYAKLVYDLSGVDKSKVTEFSFEYSKGIITGGTVKINGHTYTLTGSSWSAT